MVIVKIIIIPPNKVSTLGFSLITNHTQIGPSITSNKKKRFQLTLLVQIELEKVQDLQLSLDADHVWKQRKHARSARNDPSGGLDFRRKCCNCLTNRHCPSRDMMTMKR